LCISYIKEFKMKKIAGKIAMILILVMVAGMLASCFTIWVNDHLIIHDGGVLEGLGWFFLGVPAILLDIALWPITIPYAIEHPRGVYIADTKALLTEEEYAFLTGKTISLPEADRAFLTAFIAALPEAERAAALEQVNSVPEQQFASVVKAIRALYALPQADRVFLVEAIRSLPEGEQIFLTGTRNSLTDGEIAALADELSSIPAAEMARQIEIFRETPYSDWGYREYAAERFATP
jgi:hypothetical protein